MMYTQEQYDALLAVCRSYRQDVERLEKNMKSLIEAEKKRAVNEFAEKVKENYFLFLGKEICSDIDAEYVGFIINKILEDYQK